MKLAAICMNVAKSTHSTAGARLNLPCEAASAEAKTTGISAAESVLGRAANIQDLGEFCFMVVLYFSRRVNK